MNKIRNKQYFVRLNSGQYQQQSPYSNQQSDLRQNNQHKFARNASSKKNLSSLSGAALKYRNKKGNTRALNQSPQASSPRLSQNFSLQKSPRLEPFHSKTGVTSPVHDRFVSNRKFIPLYNSLNLKNTSLILKAKNQFELNDNGPPIDQISNSIEFSNMGKKSKKYRPIGIHGELGHYALIKNDSLQNKEGVSRLDVMKSFDHYQQTRLK